MLRRRYSNKGLSLIELVIAVGILTAGITVVLEALSFSAGAAGISCDFVNAVLLVEDKMQELEFKEKHGLIDQEPPETENQEGKFTLKPVLNKDETLGLYKLDFDVMWQRSKRKEDLKLNTYFR